MERLRLPWWIGSSSQDYFWCLFGRYKARIGCCCCGFSCCYELMHPYLEATSRFRRKWTFLGLAVSKSVYVAFTNSASLTPTSPWYKWSYTIMVTCTSYRAQALLRHHHQREVRCTSAYMAATSIAKQYLLESELSSWFLILFIYFGAKIYFLLFKI